MFHQQSQADTDALLEQMLAANERCLAHLPTAEDQERLVANWHAAQVAEPPPNAAPTPPAARRGRPLPFAIRQQIAALRASGATLRQIAAAAGVAVNTARRYSAQISQQV